MSILLTGVLGCAAAQAGPAPVNPHATPEARALLAYLDSISGKAIISGQHNYPNEGARWTDRAYDLTGKYPGLFGQDFGFSGGDDKDSVLARPAIIEEIKRQHKNGAVIALTWHEVKPTDDEPVGFRDSVQGHLTDYEWKQLLTPGTPIYNRWCAQVDVVAGYLRQLRDAHVPVLYRPYHEINGNWFWWTGRPGKDGSAALYRQLYDRFVNVHHLDNLVWVWNVNAPNPGWPPLADYYPGAQYVDVASIDIYGEFKQEFYNSMVELAGDKPVALAEVGALPSLDVLNRQPRWTYFMAWSEFIETASTLEQANAIYHAPQVLTRDDPRLAEPMAAIRKLSPSQPSAEPVSASPTPAAKALLARLHTAPGKPVLSGQQNDPAAPSAATAAVAQATQKLPAIYASDLGGPAETRSAILKQALANPDAVVSLGWLPARPTDNAPATAHGLLTDYEWNQLLTPGTDLNLRWAAQVDEAAATLRELQKAGIAVLWNPYPESNGKDFWWAGRKGIHGSAELYRQLFDRLNRNDGVENLVWVWEAAAPDIRQDGSGAGEPSDFFPGLLFADAIELQLKELNSRFPSGRFLAQVAVGKPIGVELTGNLPSPDTLFASSGWSWFLAAPTAAAQPDALRQFYADPHIASLPVGH
jgi:mannan endo-1,4-beta-mannosidase